jgi:hypothetical protein
VDMQHLFGKASLFFSSNFGKNNWPIKINVSCYGI